jgi:hypothetical protein
MRRRLVTLLAVLPLVGLFASVGATNEGCAYDWTFTDDGGPNVKNDSSNGLDALMGEDTSTNDGPLLPDAVLPPPPTPCTIGQACPNGQYCRFADHMCGRGQPQGSCTPFQTLCPAQEPVCGCDGKFALSPCTLQKVNDDVNAAGGCTAEPPVTDSFPCGYRFCIAKAEFCHVYISDAATKTVEYSCESLKSCSPASCTCPTIVALGANCACMELDPMRSYRVLCK